MISWTDNIELRALCVGKESNEILYFANFKILRGNDMLFNPATGETVLILETPKDKSVRVCRDWRGPSTLARYPRLQKILKWLRFKPRRKKIYLDIENATINGHWLVVGPIFNKNL